MAHYIDLCKVKIVSEKFFDENEDALISVGDVRGALLMAPVEDVAPRAEVANKICCEIEEEIVAALESNYRALKKWDDGRCNDYILEMVNRIKGKIDALRGIEAFVEELKNKYAEVQK